MKSQCFDHQCGAWCLCASPRTIHPSVEFMESRQETPHNRLLKFHDLATKFCRPAPHRHPIMTFLYQASKGGDQRRHTRWGGACTASVSGRKDDWLEGMENWLTYWHKCWLTDWLAKWTAGRLTYSMTRTGYFIQIVDGEKWLKNVDNIYLIFSFHSITYVAWD